MNKKEEFVNCILDALGIVIIFVAGCWIAVNHMWYNPLISTISIIVGYVLVKGTVTFPEEKEPKE